ncbi:chromo domain-like protein [Apiospora aurea]|uniref:Chromo domain-like protein n=1 Tax=Apiospora aurea TaxID=335848 RepID=A0ABR1QXV5_9PEZI
MPPQENTSDSDGGESPVFGQRPHGNDFTDSDDSEDQPPLVATDLPELLDHDDDETGKKTRKSSLRNSAATLRGGRKGRGKTDESPKKSVVSLGDGEDDGMDSDDSYTRQAHQILSRFGKKAEEPRHSRQKGKHHAEETADDVDESETPKSSKKRGRPHKSVKTEESAQSASKSTSVLPLSVSKSGQSGLGRGRPRKSSTPQSSLGQGNGPASSPLKRKDASKVGARSSPRRSARAAAIADKAAKAKAAGDNKANEAQDATPAPKCRRATSKKRSNSKKDDDHSGVYVVEDIVGHKIDKTGQLLFEVKWKNYPKSQNTWEPRVHLEGCSKTLKDYLAQIA